MASQESSSRIKLDVTNFGPINRAKVELRPLTVFVGPSNMGKSYMAMLMYALHRAVADIGKPFSRGPDSILPKFGRPSWRDFSRIPDNVIKEILAWAKGSFEECHARPSAILEAKPLPTSVASMLDNIVWGTDETSASIGHEIKRCFGIANLSSLIRKNSGSRSSVDVRVVSDRLDELLRLNLEIRREHLIMRGTTSTTVPMGITAQENPWIHLRRTIENIDEVHRLPCSATPSQSLSHERAAAQWLASELILPYLLGPLGKSSHYIPSERSGIIHAHPVLVRAMIASTATGSLHPKPSLPMLSGVLTDFLQVLIGFDNNADRKNSSINSLSRMIEEKLLNGTISIDQNPVGYPSFAYRPTGSDENFSLMQTSSMVSELAPIVLYLQKIVHDGDLFIIEQPESHIHPETQVMFAKVIARIVRHGVRVIVTTHSDWFIDQIGNLVMLSGIPSEDRHQITDGTALAESEVGVWSFEEDREDGSSHVTEIDVDPDTGLYPVDFGRVSESLYNESATIFNRMQG